MGNVSDVGGEKKGVYPAQRRKTKKNGTIKENPKKKQKRDPILKNSKGKKQGGKCWVGGGGLCDVGFGVLNEKSQRLVCWSTSTFDQQRGLRYV